MTRIWSGSQKSGWFDDRKGAAGAKSLRRELSKAAKTLKRAKRSLKDYREGYKPLEAGIRLKEQAVSSAESDLERLKRDVGAFRG